MVSCFREFQEKLCSALALRCLLGSVTLAQNVETGYLPGIDFSKYHTYGWVASQYQHPDPTVDAQIKQSFDTQLAARGLKKTDGIADSNVDYEIKPGTFFINMYDTATKQLAWDGAASKILDTKSSSEDRPKNVAKAAKKLLAQYPPK